MSLNFTQLTEPLYRYFLDHALQEPEVLRQLRDKTAGLDEAEWQVSPEQAQFMRLLVKISGARRILEIGTFTGYGTLSFALALPEDGSIVTCDIESTFPDIGRTFWDAAGVMHKIDARIEPGVELCDNLLETGAAGTFDLVFIDADKPHYPDYYEKSIALIRTGGLILIDNVFWGGSVIDPADTRGSTRAIRATNQTVHTDPRVEMSIIPIGDGLTLARKIA